MASRKKSQTIFGKRVLVFGTFDLLHPGHRYFLREAKKYGEKLFVVIARDTNVFRVKNKWPRDNEKTRLEHVQKLSFVFKAYLGYKNWEKRYQMIQKIHPDIICKGYDQKIRDIPGVQIIPISSYAPHRYNSTILAQRKKM